MSHQTKHVRDIAAIVKSQGETLETVYISTWVNRKGLQTVWIELLDIIQSHP